MDLELTEEQKMIQKLTRDFSQEKVKPLAAELDETSRYPSELIEEMAGLGLMGIAIPEEYGGAGMDNVCYAIALEEISCGCASTGVIMSVNNSLVCDPLYKNGSEDQKVRVLAPLASGEKLGCFGLTEPQAGSDASNQKTTAVRDGDSWVLNGQKNFITNGAEADTAIVFASTDREKGHRGISAFIVESNAPGFSVPKVEKKLGISASSTAELLFEDCRIPAENLLGEQGKGFRIALETLDGGRIGIAAQALGIARAALEASIQYSQERVQFNQPIARFQAIQFMISDMATELDAARFLTHRAACLKDRNARHTTESSMAKLFASEMAMRVTTKAIQIHGGYGYVKEYPVERHFRDAKITEIYEGTSEVQRMVIAANLLKEQ
jgi:butyryl-CoA dehydrogenase